MGTMTEPADQKALSVYLSNIDRLTEPHTEQDDYVIKDITRHHWKPCDGNTVCSNRSCRKVFSLLERPHHCRKCGGIFCSNCLKFCRKLNKLANLDPDGKMYKVCEKCHTCDQETNGRMRNLTEEFRWLRMCSKFDSAALVRGQMSSSRRDKIDLAKECQRLRDGFKDSVASSEVMRTILELRNMVSIPEWQKSSVWMQESLSESCHLCRSGFGFLRKRLFCRVCGLAVCKTCSEKDLLVYFPDTQPGEPTPTPTSTKLAVIRIIGCPEVEPKMSLYLRVCPSCREHVVERQISELQMSREDEDDTGSDLLSQLSRIHVRFQKAEAKVNYHLPQYQEVVQSLEDNSRGSEGNGSRGPKSNMKILAKAQGDLADFLTQHVMVVQQLKKLKPQTDTQSCLLKNYIKCKCDYYLENMYTYRVTRRRLCESSPPEVLELIQNVMDKNAVVSAHMYLRQLIYETIALCAKYQLAEEIPRHLTPLEQALESDVQKCVERDGEQWEHHQEACHQLLKEQMKAHRLIKPSRRRLQKEGSHHADQIMKQRSRDILTSIIIQLQMKAANRCFTNTKKCLEEAVQTFPSDS